MVGTVGDQPSGGYGAGGGVDRQGKRESRRGSGAGVDEGQEIKAGGITYHI